MATPPGPPPRGPPPRGPPPSGPPPPPAGPPALGPPGTAPPLPPGPPPGAENTSPPLPAGPPPGVQDSSPPLPSGPPPGAQDRSPPLPSGPPPGAQPPLPPGAPPRPRGPPPLPLPAESPSQPPLPSGPPPSSECHRESVAPPLPSVPATLPPLPPGPAPGSEAAPDKTSPPLQSGAASIPLQFLADGHCTRRADVKQKGSTTHVIIKDFCKVASALKVPLPKLGSPCALLSVFEGHPMASELCAKNFHKKLLPRLSKLGADARCTGADLRRCVTGAILELDVELRQSQPGLEGCGAAIAFLSGQTLLLTSAGQCCATLCGTNPGASFADKDGKQPPKRSWTSLGAPRALNPEAVAAAAKKAAGLSAPPTVHKGQVGSIEKLQAKKQRNIGSSSLGAFGGAKPGALDPTAVKNTRVAAIDKGMDGDFSADDMRTEVIPLSVDHHALLLLGTSGLYRCKPLDLAVVASEHPRDLAMASTNAAQLAHKHTVHKTSDDACWVQNEKMRGFEITCVAARFVWNEPLLKLEPTVVAPKVNTPIAQSKSDIPEHLLPKVEKAERELHIVKDMPPEEAANRASAVAYHSEMEKARKRARLLAEQGRGEALGPQLPDQVGEAVELAPNEDKPFNMDDLDSTARWRVRMARAEYMRGGETENSKDEKAKGKKGKGKGKGKGKKGKGKGKGRGKGKKRKKGEETGDGGDDSGDDEEFGDEGEYESGDEECEYEPAGNEGQGDEQENGDVEMGTGATDP